MVKLIRDDDGVWANAPTWKRVVGLVGGLLLSGLVFIPGILILLFLIGRL
jgi:hypothetical protein